MAENYKEEKKESKEKKIPKAPPVCEGCWRWEKFGKDCWYYWDGKKFCTFYSTDPSELPPY